MHSGIATPEKPKPAAEPAGMSADPAQTLLGVVRDLADELHPDRRRARAVELDSDLESDLGFDSLGRAELLLRLERAFKIRLPERLLGEADTPRDLLDAVLAESSTGAATAPVEADHTH